MSQRSLTTNKQFNVWGVVVAAGRGRRFGRELKQFTTFASQPLVVSSLKALNQVKEIKGLVLVVPPQQVKYGQSLLTAYELTKVKKVVSGGGLRQESVFKGLLAVPEGVDLVIVHDGVRPNITAAMVEKMLAVFPCHADGLIMALPAFDSLKLVKENKIVKTIPREDVWLAQTPQIFKQKILREALKQAQEKGLVATDEAQLVEAVGGEVFVFPGSPFNIKVTTKEDLAVASRLNELLEA